MALSGKTAPGGGTFVFVKAHTAINGPGDVTFVFALDPPFPASLEGFIYGCLYAFSRTAQQLGAVVVPGVTPEPGFGLFQSVAQHASLNNSCDIVFAGVVRTAGGASPDLGQGIFVADRNGRISKVMAPGDPAPGGHVLDFAMNPW